MREEVQTRSETWEFAAKRKGDEKLRGAGQDRDRGRDALLLYGMPAANPRSMKQGSKAAA